MKLIISSTSPYARKIVILIKELGLESAFQFETLNPLKHSDALRKINPLSKVPALVTASGTLIVNSPVIARFIDDFAVSEHNKASLTRPSGIKLEQLMSLESLCDEMSVSAILWVMERARPREQQSDHWINRWQLGINTTLDYIEKIIETNSSQDETFHLGEIALVCALDYLAFRLGELNWLQQRPHLAAWLAIRHTRTSVIETKPAE
ncbi:MAG: glutathione S-transferase N-terminal domain-containing protein [Gammaproteobacteria bacterium]